MTVGPGGPGNYLHIRRDLRRDLRLKLGIVPGTRPGHGSETPSKAELISSVPFPHPTLNLPPP